jgi:PIN domain nuclease of toxin-antitoxin system
LILFDTHVVIWLAQDDRRISSTAKSAIEATREIRKSGAVPTIS